MDLTGQSAAQAAQAVRRTSHKSNGHGDGADSPISRTGTPSMYNHNLSSFMVDDPYQSAGFHDGRAGSPLNGDRSLDAPMTHEQLIANNSSLKTRVSELEVINELFRGRLSQLEQQEAAARRGQEVAGVEQSQLRSQLDATLESEAQLRAQLEDSHRRENVLKRRLDELELEFKEVKDAQNSLEPESERPAKRSRVDSFPKEEIARILAASAVAEQVKDEAAPVEEPIAASEAVKPTEPTEPTEPAEAAEAVEAVEPVAPAESSEPVEASA